MLLWLCTLLVNLVLGDLVWGQRHVVLVALPQLSGLVFPETWVGLTADLGVLIARVGWGFIPGPQEGSGEGHFGMRPLPRNKFCFLSKGSMWAFGSKSPYWVCQGRLDDKEPRLSQAQAQVLQRCSTPALSSLQELSGKGLESFPAPAWATGEGA